MLVIVVSGGMLGPFLMLVGIARLSPVTGSLLLNLEAPFTVRPAAPPPVVDRYTGGLKLG